jgi:hypothetical protein
MERCVMPSIVQGEFSNLLGMARGVNLNSAGTDTPVSIIMPQSAKYIVRHVIVTNASSSLAISTATLGVFTATGGGGTSLVAAATMGTLTNSLKFISRTLLLTDETFNAALLYLRNTIAHGSAMTVDVYTVSYTHLTLPTNGW